MDKSYLFLSLHYDLQKKKYISTLSQNGNIYLKLW
jgi:hypothetical protein